MIVQEYKMDGAEAQYRAIDAAIHATQFVRNKCVAKWRDGRNVKPYLLVHFTKDIAKEYPFARVLDAQARQAAAERAAQSILRFYKNCREKKPGKKGYPRFQKDCRSVEYKQTGWKLDASGTHLTLRDGHKAGRFKLRGTQDITAHVGNIKRIRIVRRADGYYAQFIVAGERKVESEATGKNTGIDLGLTHFLTDSEGATVANPRHLRKSEQSIKRLGRAVSRKKKGGKNRTKAKNKLARKHLKVQRQRRDFAIKTARALIVSNDMIAYENLRVAHMVKNRHLAKSISDAGWRSFLNWLEYLAKVHGKVVVAVQPQFTSQDCSRCGKRVKKALSERTHHCPKCGLEMDRDHNAARNILTLGLRILEETTAGHAESNAWGPDTLYSSSATAVGKVAG